MPFINSTATLLDTRRSKSSLTLELWWESGGEGGRKKAISTYSTSFSTFKYICTWNLNSTAPIKFTHAPSTIILVPTFLAQCHQQKIKKLICGYIAIYSDKINSNIEIQVFKYIRIHRTSKMHSTTRNMYSAIHATVYKVLHEMPRIQEHVLSLYNLL